ncbi:MAG: Rpn family recombination-promoting nuclease/putative transposase [Desulfobacterales bacterium]|nr:Rpn family recombination-promoting nuclease/putative transposase [Desulfobacterales bacterium]
MTDDIALYIFELRKFEKKRKAGLISGDDLGDWLNFFNHAPDEGEKAMRTHYKNPAIHKAFNILETLSADDKVRRLAEMREKALKNEISELAAAKREGKKEGREEGSWEKARSTAENLLKMGVLTLKQIAEATGLTEEAVSEIQKNL